MSKILLKSFKISKIPSKLKERTNSGGESTKTNNSTEVEVYIGEFLATLH